MYGAHHVREEKKSFACAKLTNKTEMIEHMPLDFVYKSFFNVLYMKNSLTLLQRFIHQTGNSLHQFIVNRFIC